MRMASCLKKSMIDRGGRKKGWVTVWCHQTPHIPPHPDSIGSLALFLFPATLIPILPSVTSVHYTGLELVAGSRERDRERETDRERQRERDRERERQSAVGQYETNSSLRATLTHSLSAHDGAVSGGQLYIRFFLSSQSSFCHLSLARATALLYDINLFFCVSC